MKHYFLRGDESKFASTRCGLGPNLFTSKDWRIGCLVVGIPSHWQFPGDSVRSLKEFRHNTRLLVSRYEDKVRLAAERKRHCENVILSAAKEQERLQAADNISEADVKSCKERVLELRIWGWEVEQKLKEGCQVAANWDDRTKWFWRFWHVLKMFVVFCCYLSSSQTQMTIPNPWAYFPSGFAWKAAKMRCCSGQDVLIGALEHLDYFSHHIGNVIIPFDFHIFQRGSSTTNQI